MDSRDLCTIGQIKNWINSTNQNFAATDDSSILPGLITDVSIEFLKLTGRDSLNEILPYDEWYDGSGSDRQFLKNFPVILVSSVQVDGYSVPQSTVSPNGITTTGWAIDRTRESLSMIGANGSTFYSTSPYSRQVVGWSFGRKDDSNRQNVHVCYFAGFTNKKAERGTVGASPFTLQSANGIGKFFMDLGVLYARPQAGRLVAFQQVQGTPAGQSQYSVDANGLYSFHPSDSGQQVALSYAYHGAEEPIQQACIEVVVEAYKRKGSMGMLSQGNPELGTTSYTRYYMSQRVKGILALYERKGMVGV